MNLKELRTSYYELSGKARDSARTLAWSGLGAIWIFKTADDRIPEALFFPGLALVVALAFDLLQYVAGTVVWSAFLSRKEHERTPEAEQFLAPAWLNTPGNVFFFGKLLTVAIAYVFLIDYLFRRVTTAT